MHPASEESRTYGASTYLVSSMLSDEASPELILELAARTIRRMAKGPMNPGPRNNTAGPAAGSKPRAPHQHLGERQEKTAAFFSQIPHSSYPGPGLRTDSPNTSLSDPRV